MTRKKATSNSTSSSAIAEIDKENNDDYSKMNVENGAQERIREDVREANSSEMTKTKRRKAASRSSNRDSCYRISRKSLIKQNAIEQIVTIANSIDEGLLDEVACEEILRGGDSAEGYQSRITASVLMQFDNNANQLYYNLSALLKELRKLIEDNRSLQRVEDEEEDNGNGNGNSLEAATSLWEYLLENGISQRKLNVILYCLMMINNNGHSMGGNGGSFGKQAQRCCVGLKAAAIYILLIRLYNLYLNNTKTSEVRTTSQINPLIFRKAINLLVVSTTPAIVNGGNPSNARNKKRRTEASKKRSAKNNNNDQNEGEEGEEGNVSGPEDEADDSSIDKKRLVEDVLSSVEDMIVELKTFFMDRMSSPIFNLSLWDLVSHASDEGATQESSPILSMVTHCIEVLTSVARSSVSPELQTKSYDALSTLVPPQLSEAILMTILPIVFKNLLANVLGVPELTALNAHDTSSSLPVTIPKHSVVSRNQAIKFILESLLPLISNISISAVPSTLPQTVDITDEEEEVPLQRKPKRSTKKKSKKGKRKDDSDEEVDEGEEEDYNPRQKQSKKNTESAAAVVKQLTPEDLYLALLEHLCARVPEKAEYRSQAYASLIQLIQSVKTSQAIQCNSLLNRIRARFFNEFLVKFGKSSRVSSRVLSVEIAHEYIVSLTSAADTISDENISITRLLFEYIIGRVSDKAANVRAKALSSVANHINTLSTSKSKAMEQVREVFIGLINGPSTCIFTLTPIAINVDTPSSTQINLVELATRRIWEIAQAVLINVNNALTEATNPSQFYVSQLQSLLHQSVDPILLRCCDNSVALRKQAITTITSLTKLHHCFDSEYIVTSLSNSSSSLATVMSNIGKVLRTTWMSGVMPMAADPELSVTDSFVEAFDEVVLSPIRESSIATKALSHPHTSKAEKAQKKKSKKDDAEAAEKEENEAESSESQEDKEKVSIDTFESTVKKLVEQRTTNGSQAAEIELAWRFILEINRDGESSRYLTKACALAAGKGLGDKKLISKLLKWADIAADVAYSKSTDISRNTKSLARSSSEASWRLLAELTGCESAKADTPKNSQNQAASIAPAAWVDSQPIIQRWKLLNKDIATLSELPQDEEVYVLRVLTVLRNISSFSLTESFSCKLATDIMNRLELFKSTPALIHSFASTLSHLHATSTKKKVNETIKSWSRRLLAKCEEELATLVLPLTTSTQPKDEAELPSLAENAEKMKRYIFSLGEMAGLCAGGITKRMIAILQSLLSLDRDSSTDLTITTEEDSISVSGSILVPPSVRAYALVALGKLCLEDESLAKKCVSIFAAELRMSPYPAIRNNAAVVLCDLAVRYTSLIEPYTVDLALCLRDSSEPVRRQTLALLSTLLQQDYLKWRASATSMKEEDSYEESKQSVHLFQRFLLPLVDSSIPIRRLAMFTIMTRHRNALHSMFVDTVFHLNGYHHYHGGKGTIVRSTLSSASNLADLKLFTLRGQGNRNDRLEIYQLLLQNMTDEQKFHVNAKLCQEILGAVCDGNIDLELLIQPEIITDQAAKKNISNSEPKVEFYPGIDVLQDALDVLASKEIKLSHSSSKSDSGEVAEGAEEAMAAAKGKLLSKVMKKNVIENIVPIIVELKHMLERKRSPLLRSLVTFLRELMKDYRDEVSDILVADKRLAKEIDYDLRQFEQQQQQQQLQLQQQQQQLLLQQQQQQQQQAQQAQQQQQSQKTLKSAIRPASTFSSPSAVVTASSGSRRTSMVVNAQGRASIILSSPLNTPNPNTPASKLSRRFSAIASPAITKPKKTVTFSPSLVTPRDTSAFSVPRIRPTGSRIQSPGSGAVASGSSSSPSLAGIASNSDSASSDFSTMFNTSSRRPLGVASAKLKALSVDKDDESEVIVFAPEKVDNANKSKKWNLRKPVAENDDDKENKEVEEEEDMDEDDIAEPESTKEDDFFELRETEQNETNKRGRKKQSRADISTKPSKRCASKSADSNTQPQAKRISKRVVN